MEMCEIEMCNDQTLPETEKKLTFCLHGAEDNRQLYKSLNPSDPNFNYPILTHAIDSKNVEVEPSFVMCETVQYIFTFHIILQWCSVLSAVTFS